MIFKNFRTRTSNIIYIINKTNGICLIELDTRAKALTFQRLVHLAVNNLKVNNGQKSPLDVKSFFIVFGTYGVDN